ncbi:LamG domain-containing protein, partial [Fulvivirga sp. RKSG066]|uniref:LamG domain-containing protein n=1 Tax=Fulvivirga aurantia TaxID=2529383 RepID=UPI0012BC5968
MNIKYYCSLLFLFLLVFGIPVISAKAQTPVTWTDLAGVEVQPDNALKKTAGWGTTNAGAASEEVLAANTDGWAEFTISTVGVEYIFGLSEINVDESKTIDYAIRLHSNGNISILEKGSWKAGYDPAVAGDVYRLERINNEIVFKKNGVAFHTSPTPSTSSLLVDVSIYHTGAEVTGAQVSFGSEIATNDDKVNALEITSLTKACSSGKSYNNFGATNDGVPPSVYTNLKNNVWFKFQAQTNGIQIKISKADAGALTGYVMALYDENDNEIDATRFNLGYDVSSNKLVVGNWYYLSVGGGSESSFDLCFNDDIQNDFQEDALDISFSGLSWTSSNEAFDNYYATKDNQPSYNHGNVWFKFRANKANASIELIRGNMPNTYVVYLMDESNNQIGFVRFNNGNKISVNNLIEGNWYYLSVGSGGYADGVETSTFDLSIQFTGKVSSYDFNACEGTVLTDNIGTLNGTVHGAKWIAGYEGQGLKFDGVDDYVKIEGSEDDFSFVQNTGVFTIATWVKIDDLNSRNIFIANSGGWVSKGFSLRYEPSGSGTFGNKQIVFQSTTGRSNEYNKISGAIGTISDNNWHHVAVVGDGSTATIYVDGNEDGTGVLSYTTPGNSDFPVYFGIYPSANNGDLHLPLKGSLDNIHIYNKSLSPTEINQFASELSNPGYCNFEASYDFNSCDGTILTDNSGTLNGTVNGATWSPGYNGQALSFDGVDDRAYIPFSENLKYGQQLSVAGWVKAPAQSNVGTIASQHVGGNVHNKKGWLLSSTTINGQPQDRLQITISSDGTGTKQKIYYSSIAVFDDQWHHITFTFDNGDLRLYIDGEEDTGVVKYKDEALSTINVNEEDLTIGYSRIDNSDARFLLGKIDQLEIYNKALSAAEISDLAALPYSTTSCLETVEWQDIVSVTPTSSNGLRKSITTAGYNAGAYSKNRLPLGEDGYFEFVVANQNARLFMGLSKHNADVNYLSIDYSIFIFNNNYYVYERGVKKYEATGVKANDEFRVERQSGKIRYFRNNELFYTSEKSSHSDLSIDASFFNHNDEVKDVFATFEVPTNVYSSDLQVLKFGESGVGNFVRGDGTHSIVIARMGEPITSVPEDGFTYNANEVFGQGDEIAPGHFVVYNGTGTTFNIRNLTEINQNYYFRVIDYTSPSSPIYNSLGAEARNIGNNITWNNKVGVQETVSNGLKKISGGGGYNAGAFSENRLAENSSGW